MNNVSSLIRSGFKWNTIFIIISSILLPLSYILLAKLMGRVEFGRLAIVTVYIGLSEMLSQFGIAQAIIKKRTNSKLELNSIFWINISIGSVLFLIGFFLASFISSFYADSELKRLLQIASFVFLLRQLPLIYKALLQKSMSFNVLTPIEIAEICSKVFISVLLVYMGYGVMGVLIGQITSVFIFILLIFRYAMKTNIWFPKFQLSIDSIKEYYGFGLWVTLKSLLNFVGANIDIILIGKLVSTESLGIYNFAKKIIQEPRNKLSAIFEKVSFPAFSMLINLEREKKLKVFEKKYLYFIKVISLLGFPVFGFLIVAIPHFVTFFFDPQWSESVILMQIFCFSAIFELLSAGFATSALYSLGLPQKVAKVDFIMTPIRIVTIFLIGFFTGNIQYISLLYTFLVVVKVIYLQYYINCNTNLNFIKFGKNIQVQFFSTFASVFLVYLLGKIIGNQFFIIFVFIPIVGLFNYIFSKRFIRYLIRDIKRGF